MKLVSVVWQWWQWQRWWDGSGVRGTGICTWPIQIYLRWPSGWMPDWLVIPLTYRHDSNIQIYLYGLIKSPRERTFSLRFSHTFFFISRSPSLDYTHSLLYLSIYSVLYSTWGNQHHFLILIVFIVFIVHFSRLIVWNKQLSFVTAFGICTH